MVILKKILLILIACVAWATISAKEYHISSPDGQIRVTVYDKPSLGWSLSHGEELLLDRSHIALQIGGNESQAHHVRRAVRRSVDTQSPVLVPTKFSTTHDRYNELRLTLAGDLAIVFRLYDNGAAYRFESSQDREIEIRTECAEFNFAADCQTLWPREENPDFISHCEAFFDRKLLSELEPKKYAYLPVYVATPQGTRMVITETDLSDYPCLFLFGGNGRKLHAQFPPIVLESRLKRDSDRNEEFLQKAPYIAKTAGTRTFPWRIVTVNVDDRALLENNLACQLAAPAVEGDTSWIRPGKIAWDWWNSMNVYGVDFKAGVNTATYKYFIDFAADHGIEYILMDEGWSVSTLNIKEPRAEIDLDELLRYSRQKGVGILLWTLWNPMKKDLYGILDLYRKWGVKGIKIDFMQRSDQEMVRFYEQIAQAAFDRELLVDFHGSFKPSGQQRKYPNVMTFEGVYGMEHDKCSTDISPVHDCTLPFTRMVAGPMDYTPGATINATRQDFAINWDHPMSQGTRAHQAALYVVFESPLQMLCDSPSNYRRNPEFTQFIAQIPTTWDQTIALYGAVGEYVAIARRHKDTWYIGAITDWTPRNMEIDLGFLPNGNYRMNSFEDGVNANSFAQDFRTDSQSVSRNQKLKIELASGGGWAAIITPEHE